MVEPSRHSVTTMITLWCRSHPATKDGVVERWRTGSNRCQESFGAVRKGSRPVAVSILMSIEPERSLLVTEFLL